MSSDSRVLHRRLASEWDVIVIGAGPAGALAAYLSAQRSLRTLLVEKNAFPRQKVCGGCLNRRSQDILSDVGLGGLCNRLKATRIDALRLACAGRSANISLPHGRALSRAAFDSELVARAIDAGAKFVDNTRASVRPARGEERTRQIELHDNHGGLNMVSAKVVLAADGLGHASLAQLASFQLNVDCDSHIGLGTTIARRTPCFPPNMITMVIGRHGYVGGVVVEKGQLNIAAAVSPAALHCGAERAVSNILSDAGIESDVVSDAKWSGTRPLSCQSTRVADHRLFLIGDSTGYVEPFTGEGIAWALASAVAVAALVERSCQEWNADYANAWQQNRTRARWRDQRLCRAIRKLLRRPYLSKSVVTLLHWYPRLAWPLVRRISGSAKQQEVLR